jgi:hypothetical protein
MWECRICFFGVEGAGNRRGVKMGRVEAEGESEMSNLVLGRELREEDEIRVLIGAAGDAREMVKSCSHLRKNFR